MTKLHLGMGEKRGHSKPGGQEPAGHIRRVTGNARPCCKAHSAGDDTGYAPDHNRGNRQALDSCTVDLVDSIGDLVSSISLADDLGGGRCDLEKSQQNAVREPLTPNQQLEGLLSRRCRQFTDLIERGSTPTTSALRSASGLNRAAAATVGAADGTEKVLETARARLAEEGTQRWLCSVAGPCWVESATVVQPMSAIGGQKIMHSSHVPRRGIGPFICEFFIALFFVTQRSCGATSEPP